METDLPKEIIQKKKIGLEIPYSQWFCSELRELLLDHLSDTGLREIPFLNRRFVMNIVDEHLQKRRDRGRELWGLLNFVIWHRHRFG
jgi:asparagine synthase (glutamine-hydrolysing)